MRGWCLLLGMMLTASALAEPVVVVMNRWGSQQVISRVVADIVNASGHPAELLELSTREQQGALLRGAAHIQIEFWQTDPTVNADAFLKNPQIKVVGQHQAYGREEWWYPDYVKARCPGLPDWQALNQCKAMFADANGSHGLFWTAFNQLHDQEVINALKLDFHVQKVENGPALTELLAAAAEAQRPIVAYNWSPNWTQIDIPGEFVAFPAYTPECHQDPAWGPNKTHLYDCGNPVRTPILKVVSVKLADISVCASELVDAISLTEPMMARASWLIERQHYSISEAAKVWRQIFATEVQAWIPASCQ